MKKLADSIERFVGSGGRTFSSFWDAFKQGFADGVQRAPEFLKMLHNIRHSLTTSKFNFGPNPVADLINIF